MKRLSRRTLLRAASVSVALPWMESMAPAAQAPPVRYAFIYVPNGVILDNWTPRNTGSGYDLAPALRPLEPVRQHVSVLSHLDRKYVSGTGVHAQCGSCWLTSSPPTEALDGGFPTNVSLDQMIARKVGGESALPSLELSCNDHTDNKETRYFESVSWLAPGYAANVEKNPRAVFERLFGNIGQDPASRSVLDLVREDANDLRALLGRTDQVKLDEYLESVRSVERRISISEKAARRSTAAPIAEPEGIPENRGAYIRLMMDLMVLAFQQDLTRVATLLVDPERWDSPRMYHGLFDKPEDHHQLTHTKGEEARIKLTKIDHFHVTQYAWLVNRLASIREGEGTLLDNSVVVMGSGLGDGSVHSYRDLPLLSAGSAGGRLKTGQHFRFNPGTPVANYWLTLLRTAGVDQPRFADSTGVLGSVAASTAG